MEGGLGISVSTLSAAWGPGDEDSSKSMPILHRAVVQGDFEELTRILDELLDRQGGEKAGDAVSVSGVINQRDSAGNTCLHFAADRGFVAVARLLLERGAEVDAEDGDGNSPLMLAVLCEHDDMAQLLRERGATR